MGRYKFPGKPTKHVNKKRVNVLSHPSTKTNETSIGYNETLDSLDNYYNHCDNSKRTKISSEHNMQETVHGITNYKCNPVTEELKLISNNNSNNKVVENKSNDCERLSTVRSNKTSAFLYKNYHLKHDGPKSRKKLIRKSSELKIVSRTDSHETVSKKRAVCNTRRSLYRRKKQLIEKSITRESMNLVGKFILPSKSLHSSRVIIPNKRFINSEQSESKRNRTPKVEKIVASNNEKIESNISHRKEQFEKKPDQSVSNIAEFCLPKESSSKDSTDMVLIDSSGSISPKPCSKLVLRKARLQLRTHVSGDMDGPFSSYSTSTPNPPGTVTCGVCGAVRFYRFVKQARKFNIYSCESCRKFISKMIKRQSCAKNSAVSTLVCHKGQGMCHVPPIVRSQQWKLLPCAYKARCPACWLKMCLQAFQMPSQLKLSLVKMLPENMRTYDNYNKIYAVPNISQDIILQENSSTDDTSQPTLQEQLGKLLESSISPVRLDILSSKTDTLLQDMKNKNYQKPRTRIGMQNKNTTLDKESPSINSECTKRQKIDLKGPRVKHVCRSASIALGQPIATFSRGCNSEDVAKHSPSEPDSCINCITVSENTSTTTIRKKYSAVVTNKKNQKSSTEKSIVHVQASEDSIVSSPEPDNEDCLHDEFVTHLLNPVISVSADYFDNYDSENKIYSSGFGLIGSEPFTIQAVCFYCGSAGQEQLLYCACCCEPYHYYCINDNVMHKYLYNNNVNQTNLDVNTNSYLKLLWKCSRCSICYKCGKSDKGKTVCQLCRQYFHPECMQPEWKNPTKPTICSLCSRCEDCGSQDVTKLVSNLSICLPCFKLRMQQKYCSSCHIFDEQSKYVRCGNCLNIIHAECEKLTDEMYEIIRHLPLSSTYFCSTCSSEKKLSWKESVNTALKYGFHIVLRLLIRNPSAKDKLKWNLIKNLNCSCVTENSMKRIVYSNNNDFDIGNIKSNIETVLSECSSENNVDKLKFMCSEMSEEKQSKDNKFDISIKNIKKKFCIKECSVRIKNCLESKKKKLSNIVKNKECDKNSLKKYEEKNNVLTNVEFNNSEENNCSKHVLPIFLLLNIKKNINTNIYKTVKEFHFEVQRALKNSLCHELLKLLDIAIKETFPWYNPQTLVYNDTSFFTEILINEFTTNTQNVETCISTRNEKISSLLKENVAKTVTNKFITENKIDTRTCVLCHKVGDAVVGFEGRLLYCGQDQWIHVNCAFWSSEIYEEVDCSLQNVQEVIISGRKTQCSICKENGASIFCSVQSCTEVFHYICARTANCCFLTNKSVCCLHHYDADSYKLNLIEAEDFEMQRPLYVKIDIKKSKHIELSKVQYLIGCLNVTSLGTFFPALSDTEEAIIPSEFVCSRLFWSITEPWKIVRYTINTSILIPTLKDLHESEKNFIVDHSQTVEGIAQKIDISKRNKFEYGKFKNKILNSKDFYENDSINITDDDKIVLQVLENLLELICSKELEETCDDEPQNTADILPPELKDAIFEDLPHDLLDGISVQDIFPKLMSYEDIISADLKISDSIDSGESVKSVSSNDSSQNDKKSRKTDLLLTSSDLWLEPKYSVHNVEDFSPCEKDMHGQHLKRSKSEVLTGIKKINRTCSHQRSCSLTWSCKLDNTRQPSTKKRKISCTPKSVADISNNLFMLVDGNNEKNSMLQELRLPDSVLMSVGHSTNVDCLSDSVRELKYCLEETQEIEHEKENNCRVWRNKSQSRIVQLDGVDDSSSENESSSEMETNLTNVNKSTDEPVQCDKCQCTYRTPNSYKKHLTICASMSSSESDSESEEKPITLNPSPRIVNQTLNIIPNGIINSAMESSSVTKSISESTIIVNTENTNITQDIDKTTNNFMMSCLQSVCIPPNILETKSLNTPSNTEYKEKIETSVQLNQIVVNNTEIVTSTISNVQKTSNELSSLTSFVENSTTQKIPISKIAAVKKVNKQRMVKPKPVLINRNKKIPVKRNQPDKTINIVNNIAQNMNTNKTIQLPEVQNSTVGGPTVIIQHVSSPNLMPAYVEAFQQQTGQNLQCIATIVPNEYKSTPFITSNSFIPGNFQTETNLLSIPTDGGFAVIPGLGTISQSRPVFENFIQNRPTANFQSGMVSTEQVFLGSVPTIEPVVNNLQNSLYLSSSPVYYGFEAVVQNTVMQSQQFVSSSSIPGILSSNSYSATTTQVFQSSKLEPIMDMNGTSYIVVNPPVPQVPAAITVNSRHLLTQFQNKQNTIVPQPQPIFESSSSTYPLQILPVNDPFVPVVKPVIIEQVQSQIEPLVTCVNNEVIPIVTKELLPRTEITTPVTTSTCISEPENKIPMNVVTPIPQIAPTSQVLKPTNRVLPMQTQPPKSLAVNNKVLAVEPPNILNKLSQTVDRIQETLQNDVKSLQSNKLNSNKNHLLKLESASLKLVFQKQSEDGIYKISNKFVSKKKVPIKIAPIKKPNIQLTENTNNTKFKDKKEIIETKTINKIILPKPKPDNSPSILYKMQSQDGIDYSSTSLTELWKNVFNAIQSARADHKMPLLPDDAFSVFNGLQLLGLNTNGLRYLVEQLPGAGNCTKYKPIARKKIEYSEYEESNVDKTFRAARCEPYSFVKQPYDMFSWLASEHRNPDYIHQIDYDYACRRASSLNLPMAMRFRQLKETSKQTVGVYRSGIHGRGLFCLRDIECGEMVIEYAGEVIRSTLTDKREKYYNSKGIGCYMFRVDDNFVIDATMKGNAARFINHSCDPNCYSRVLEILGHKHILIFALRKIIQGEELTYDYKFPFEEDKIPCTCGAKRCRKYLN